MTPRRPDCTHLSAVVAIDEPQDFCEECLADGESWVSLQVCLTCGKVGCGAGSVRDHAALHYAETDHPIAGSVGAEPPLRWCYPDQRFV